MAERVKNFLIAALTALVLLPSGFYIASDLPDHLRLAFVGTPTEATVLRSRVRTGTTKGKTSVNLREFTYQFQALGREHTCTCKVSAFQSDQFQSAGRIPITYLNSDPTFSRFGGAKETWKNILLWDSLGLFLIGLGIFIMLPGLPAGRDWKSFIGYQVLLSGGLTCLVFFAASLALKAYILKLDATIATMQESGGWSDSIPNKTQEGDLCQADLVDLLRRQGQQVDAALLEKIVRIKADPQMWALICDENLTIPRSKIDGNLFSMATLLGRPAISMAASNGLESLPAKVNPNGDPRVLRTISSWSQKIAIEVQLRTPMEKTTLPILLENLQKVLKAKPVASPPKPIRRLILVFDENASSLVHSSSDNGTSYKLLIPAAKRLDSKQFRPFLDSGDS